MKNFKFIWLFLTNKTFRNLLKETILYSLRVYKQVKGNGCTNVDLFSQYHSDILIHDEIVKLYHEPIFKISTKDFIDILNEYSTAELEEIRNYKNEGL